MTGTVVRGRTAARSEWLRRRWRRKVEAGPRGCCWKFCRSDKAVHVGRFSEGAYGLTGSMFGAKYPDGFKIPVDGVPTGEGAMPSSTAGVGWHNVPKNTYRDYYNLDFSATQQIHSHSDWLDLTQAPLQVPDITLDWSDANLGLCYKSASIPGDPGSRSTTYGTENFGDQFTTTYTKILSTPGTFVYTKATVRSVQATFNIATGGYSAGTHNVNVIVYHNPLVAIKSGILSAPQGCWKTKVNAGDPNQWHSSGHPIPSSRSAFPKPPLMDGWDGNDLYGVDFNLGPFPSPTRDIQVGFNFDKFLYVDRENIHANSGGFGGTHASAPWFRRVVGESSAMSLLGSVSNGRATLRANFSGSLGNSGEVYGPRLLSVGSFVPDGAKSLNPQQTGDHRDFSSPQLQSSYFGGVAAFIDINSQFPDFVNTTDPGTSIYGLISWPFPGDKTENDKFAGAEWDCQLIEPTGSVGLSYRGGYSKPMFFGSRDVTWEVFDIDSYSYDAINGKVLTNMAAESWIAANAHNTPVIPRATWKANQNFCEDLGAALDQVTSSAFSPGTQILDGVNYQAGSGFDDVTVGAEWNSAAEFCRLPPGSPYGSGPGGGGPGPI